MVRLKFFKESASEKGYQKEAVEEGSCQVQKVAEL